jgi:hypothetical protein
MMFRARAPLRLRRSAAAASYRVSSGGGADAAGRCAGVNVGMSPDPSASSPPAPGRWRHLIRSLSRALGPRLKLDELPPVAIVSTDEVVSPSAGRRLHICVECGADVVNPAHAEPLDEERWTMLLRCGACGTTVHRIVSKEAARRYDHELNRGFHAIGRALEQIERDDMEEWADTFRAALGRDLIDAEDFSGH